MDLYLHDSAAHFRIQLKGRLEGISVRELEQTWRTACSVMEGKELELDLAGLHGADEAGIELLSRMRDAGACLTTALGAAGGTLDWLRRAEAGQTRGEETRPLRDTFSGLRDCFRLSRWAAPRQHPLRDS